MDQVKVNLDHIPCVVQDKTETVNVFLFIIFILTNCQQTVTCRVEIPTTASSSDQYSIRVSCITSDYYEMLYITAHIKIGNCW